MKKLLLLFVLFSGIASAQTLYFPPLTGNTWDTISPESLGYCEPSISELHDYLDSTNSKAFIMLKDGKIVFEWYYGTFTKDSFYVWNSAGKTLTGLAVGIAQEEGFLDIHDTTSHYLGQGWTSLTPQQEEKITIWHQLTMTSGLNHTGDHYCTDPACLVYIAEPGTRWMYHNGPYTLLDGVIEAATGVNLNTYVQQKIRSKIGMVGLYYPVGYNNIHLSNARSMARFGLLMLAKGKWNGTTVLGDTTYFNEMTNTSQNLNPSYGYLTWLNGKGSYMLPSPDVQFTVPTDPLPNAPDDVYAALGKNGQIINMVPSQNMVFIRMGEHDGSSLVGNEYNDTIWQKINQLSCLGLNPIKTEQIKLYPNPAQNELHWNLKSELAIVRNSDGKIVFEAADTSSIVLENLSSGIYLLELSIKGQLYHRKFVKQ